MILLLYENYFFFLRIDKHGHEKSFEKVDYFRVKYRKTMKIPRFF